MSTITLKNVSKKYSQNVYGVKDVDLDIKEKEFLILVGPSGCGKSTTLRMIAGLEDISDGELWIDDQLVNFLEPKDRELSMVFQNYALYPNMTVFDNMAFSLKVRKVDKKEIKERVTEAAKTLKIEHLLKQRPKNLSGGQKQRVAIGSAIIRNTKALLMDEPLSNLDAKLRMEMRVMISKLHQDYGNTIIYVTHDQSEAMTLGTRIVVMKDGVVQQVDTPRVLYDEPANLFVAGFIGSPPMNFMEVSVKGKGERIWVDTSTSAVPISKNHQYTLENRGYMARNVMLGIRAEDIYLAGNAEAGIEVAVISTELLGADINLYFYINGKEWCARLGADEYRGEETVRIRLDPERILLFDINTEENIMYSENRRGVQ